MNNNSPNSSNLNNDNITGGSNINQTNSSSSNINPNTNKQLPLKAYFLNKYEQLKNPNSASSLVVAGSPQALVNANNNKNILKVDNSVLSALLGDSIASSSSSLSGLTNQASNLHHHHQQQHQHNNNTNHHRLSPITSLFPQCSSSSKETSTVLAESTVLAKDQCKSSKSKMSASSASSSIASKRHFSGSNSSLQNSDEDDDYDDPLASSNSYMSRTKEEKRRLSHTAAEQKRRNAIKRGYDELQSIVPSCDYMDPSSSQKVCKATVLKRSIDYIHELQQEKDKHEDELDSLKKEITALKIMRQNYEEMLQYHRNQPKNNSMEINEDAKFDLFVKFSDNLFQSFNSMINPSSFGELSGSLFNWLEQMCSANNLKNIVYLSLMQAAQQILS